MIQRLQIAFGIMWRLFAQNKWCILGCAPYIEKMKQNAGEQILAKTGCFPSFNHGPKILWWKHEHNDVYRKIRAFVQPAGYAAMPGLWHPYAYINGGGMNLEWFCEEIASRGASDNRDSLSFKELDSLAESLTRLRSNGRKPAAGRSRIRKRRNGTGND
jgi:sugar (pentulose or hexulose) kinase